MLGHLQVIVFFVLTLGAFIIEVIALIDCARRPARAFYVEGKRTKKFWLTLLAIFTLVGFLGLQPPLGFGYLGLGALIVAVPAFIYLADVRPAIRPHGFGKGNSNGPNSRGGW
jgi:hypothetical protein